MQYLLIVSNAERLLLHLYGLILLIRCKTPPNQPVHLVSHPSICYIGELFSDIALRLNNYC